MLETIVANYIDKHQLLPAHGEVIVAVSGGADSLCLLHLLHRLCGPGKRYPGVSLHAAHLNHKLRGEASAQDAATVASIVASWGLPLTAGEVDVPALAREERRSLEDAARSARYRFLREVAHGQPIAVAHQADDQVETVLLHFLRGSGLTGMVGMLPRQQDIIRPLLEVRHVQTVAYCQEHGIKPLEDLSNADPRFLRNRIRHELLPLLESLNPGIHSTLLRNASAIEVDVAWLEEQVSTCWPAVVVSERADTVKLNIQALLALPLSLQRHLLRRVTARLCEGQSPLEIRHYTLIEQLLTQHHDRQERTLHLPQGLRVIRNFNEVIFERQTVRRGRYFADAQHKLIAPTADLSANWNVEADTSLTLSTSLSRPSPIYRPAEAALLHVPGSIEVPGTSWVAVAELVPAELMERARQALLHENWPEVLRLLPPARHAVYIDGDVAGTLLQVRTRRPGDRMQPLGMQYEKKVQDIFVDKHVARRERESVPLFFTASHCIWLAGVCLDERARLTSKTQQVVRLSIINKANGIPLTSSGENGNVVAGLTPAREINISREVDMHEDIQEILLTSEEIQTKIAELGEQITDDYRGKNLLLLGTLKGAVPFIADLARAIGLPLEIDYMAVSSYGNATESSGVVRILKDLEGPVQHKHVLIVEDIVDSGMTLHYLMDVLRQRKPLSLRVCALLDKQRERVKPVKMDYTGFQIPNQFVVGYGLDYAQRYRNLPYIGILKPSVYQEDLPEPQRRHESPAEEK
jgi:tRNA(Ile)-lysidine synthase